MTPISDKERAVLDCVVMKLSPNNAVIHCANKGIKISKRHFFTIQKKLKEKTLDRLHQISIDFATMHLERIDQLETIQSEAWKLYHKSEDIGEKTRLLKEIRETQRYISSYYEATQGVLENYVRSDKASQSLSEANPRAISS
jgi:hypothetical protein